MTPLEWGLLAYAVLVTIWCVIVQVTVDEQRETILKLQRRIHPATRNRKETHQ